MSYIIQWCEIQILYIFFSEKIQHNTHETVNDTYFTKQLFSGSQDYHTENYDIQTRLPIVKLTVDRKLYTFSNQGMNT